eukprot:3917202-Prymnesium_polylepis.2
MPSGAGTPAHAEGSSISDRSGTSDSYQANPSTRGSRAGTWTREAQRRRASRTYSRDPPVPSIEASWPPPMPGQGSRRRECKTRRPGKRRMS